MKNIITLLRSGKKGAVIIIILVFLDNEDDFRFHFRFNSNNLSNSMDTDKQGDIEKLSINSFPLFACKLVI